MQFTTLLMQSTILLFQIVGILRGGCRVGDALCRYEMQ